MATLESREHYYIIIFYSRHRTPRKKSLLFKKSSHTKKRVLEIKAELEYRYKSGDYDPWAQELHVENHLQLKLKDVIEEYVEFKSTNDWGDNTSVYSSGLIRTLGQGLPGLHIDQLKTEHLNAFINRPGLAHATKISYKRVLTTFANYLIEKEYSDSDSIKVKQIKVHASAKPSAGIKYISLEDQRQIEKHIYCKVRQHITKGVQTHEVNALWLIDFIRWQRYTGMRISETLRLKVGDIDTDNWQITIRETKAGKVQYLHIGSIHLLKKIALRKIRHANGKQDALLFNKRNANYVAKLFRTYRNEALPSSTVTIHTFRHTCAIDLLKAGVDIYRVMRWLRHADVSTTMIYADMLSIDVSAEVARAFNK